ncbi:MAG TPA: SIMPL domain-containing protein [Cytophagaceae bacterium]
MTFRNFSSKLALALSLAFFSFSAIAQEGPVYTLPVIKTEGTGKMTVAPDWVVVNMDISSFHKDFNKAVQELNKRAAGLEKQLIKAGFKKEDIKTTGYNVNKHYQYKDGMIVDTGFIAFQTFVVEFAKDQQRIVNLVNSLSESPVQVSFNFSFTLSDAKEKEVEVELLKRAVNDASIKSKALASAAGVSLKRILNITYVTQRQGPIPMYAMEAKMAGDDSAFSGFNVKDLELEKTITASWEIGQ